MSSQTKSISSSSLQSPIILDEALDNNQNNNNGYEFDKCNLNEPWLCSQFNYYETHTCTINNVCIFNEFAFIHSGDFYSKMTHHCSTSLPLNDCHYFKSIKECRSHHCSTQILCNLEVEHYEICLIKSLLCYDEYCEPDLSALPMDYRLYDLCCHINEIGLFLHSFFFFNLHTKIYFAEPHVHRFEHWVLMILGIVAIVFFVILYEISNILQGYSMKKIFCNSYKKLAYLIKYLHKNYISMKIIESKWEYFSNELCKKGKKMKRNVKYYYKNNKMIQFVFDEYIYSFSFNVNTKDLKQKHDEMNITTVPNTNCHMNAEETITFQKDNCRNNNNKRNKVMHASNSKKKKKKKKKYKNKNKSKKNRKKNKSKSIIDNGTEGTDHIIICELSDDEEKSLSTTDFEMESMSASVPMTPTDSFECEFCGYVNTLSASHCEQCSNSLYDQTGHPAADNDNDNKLFREVQKKSKKKRSQKSKKRRKQHNLQKITKSSKQFKKRANPNKKLNKCTKKINPKRRPPLKQIQRKNNLNPNAKEFVLPKQASAESLESIPSPCVMETHYSNPTLPSQTYHHHTEYPTDYPTHSPSHSHSHPRRLSKIPRLQRSVNPEFDFPPRHRRHHHSINNNNAYHSNPETHSHSNHHHGIPPRFQSPSYRNSSISPMASKDHYDHLYDDEFEFHDSEMDAQSVLSGTTFDASLLDSRNRPSFTTELDPPPPLMNLPLILPVVPPQPPLPPPLPLGSCIDSALSTMPAADTEDLQKQLSDMEKNVHQQLKVLDSLFPEYKPDLTQDIQNMQESMKDMVCFE